MTGAACVPAQLAACSTSRPGDAFAASCAVLFWTTNSDLNTRDMSGLSPSPLQIRQGMPAEPQPHAFGPFQGLLQWVSQTHPVLLQVSHSIGCSTDPPASKEHAPAGSWGQARVPIRPVGRRVGILTSCTSLGICQRSGRNDRALSPGPAGTRGSTKVEPTEPRVPCAWLVGAAKTLIDRTASHIYQRSGVSNIISRNIINRAGVVPLPKEQQQVSGFDHPMDARDSTTVLPDEMARL